MRTLVLVAAALLVVALVASLAFSKWKRSFNPGDVPKMLGLDIQQEANGWTYTHAQSGHTLYKIHASKLVQLTQGKGGRVLLHDVKIELYGEDGSRVDRIEGAEFEYDPKGGAAKANGQVEIILMRPGVAPAIAPKATPGKALGDKPKSTALAAAAETAARGEIHVKTSGLTFDQKSGLATTAERVEFTLAQGAGSSLGASYDSAKGLLVLERAVALNTQRGGETVELHAQHAEFERGDQVCRLRAVTADYRDGQATAGEAKIEFRADGSVVRLDAMGGFALTTATGSHLAAPMGLLEFDEHNQPRHGHMQGGVILDSTGEGRQMHGGAAAAELEFTPQGVLHRAHLERDVTMHSEEQSASAAGPLRVSRTWRSPAAEVGFREAGHGKLELDSIHGSGGVVVTGESQRGQGAVSPSRLAADELTGQFGPDSALSAMVGGGHVGMEQTTATGAKEGTSGDRLEAHFAAVAAGPKSPPKSELGGAAQIQAATVEGHVVLIQEPPAKPGASPAILRATAGRAVYEGAGEWLHLTESPRVEDGGLQLTADKVDVSQASGDAFARGNVKASWLQQAGGKGSAKAGLGGVSLGGDGPAHVVSAEAQLHQASGEATFRGQARLWQQANSVTAPVIVLDRNRQSLVARASSAAEPVRVVLLSAAGPGSGREATSKPATPSVIRIRGGDLKYSDVARKATMHGGVAGNVQAETETATSTSNEVELVLFPQGNHAGKDGGQAQVDRLTARGHVTIASQGRRGTGEQLVYTGETGEYVLTGTATVPPRMIDPARGTVTGEALIFPGRDDSVTVEGGGRKTTTETSAPK